MAILRRQPVRPVEGRTEGGYAGLFGLICCDCSRPGHCCPGGAGHRERATSARTPCDHGQIPTLSAVGNLATWLLAGLGLTLIPHPYLTVRRLPVLGAGCSPAADSGRNSAARAGAAAQAKAKVLTAGEHRLLAADTLAADRGGEGKPE